ncbi:MAG: hypothetical protein M1477_05770 [Candidatus Thermoplasmatota archaeon]|nr:hypothetical protein [Candidatus Thermoplasmatota archaeon]
MIVEDQRNISCGGDPFNYLKSVMKGLSISLDPGQDAEILVMKDKFPYSRDIFESLARGTKLLLTDLRESADEFNIYVRKPIS